MNRLLQRIGRYRHLIVGVLAISAFVLYVLPYDRIYAQLTTSEDIHNRFQAAHNQIDTKYPQASDDRKTFEHQRINDQDYAITTAHGLN